MNFLEDRTFTVKIGQNLSNEKPITCGVPQGGVISPILFSLYINEIPLKENKRSNSLLFADDLVDIFEFDQMGKNITDRISKRTKALENWKISEGLKLHLKSVTI